jgi:hypothetical protein
MFVRRDGTIFMFCSSKCHKNQLKLGRIGRTVKWTKRYAPRGGKVVPYLEQPAVPSKPGMGKEPVPPTPEPSVPEETPEEG